MSDDRVRQWNSTLTASKSKLGAWRDRGRGSLNRNSGLDRNTPIRKRNPERQRRRKDEGAVYGPFFEFAKAEPCTIRRFAPEECFGPVTGHHRKTVGSGGVDAENLNALCARHHTEIHQLGEKKFEARYEGLDLDLEAAALWGKFCDETSGA